MEDTQALYASSALAGLACACASLALWRRDAAKADYFYGEAQAGSDTDVPLSANALVALIEFEYASVAQVHRVAAILANRVPRDDTRPADPALVLALDVVFLTGQRQFPEAALLQVLHATFKRDIAPDQSGLANVERAKAMSPDFRERYLIFAAEMKARSRRRCLSSQAPLVRLRGRIASGARGSSRAPY